MKSVYWSLLAGGALVFLATPQVFAGQPLVVQTDKSQLITVSAEPGAVVIGNPTIADITVNGKQIFVHGRAFGDTNLLVLDGAGNQIANFDITVANNPNNAVAIFEPGKRYTYTCAPFCEFTMTPGDNFEWTDAMMKLNQTKTELATGQKSSEASAPAAPQ